jgi:hypothetical protein
MHLYLEKTCLIDINKINVKLIFRKQPWWKHTTNAYFTLLWTYATWTDKNGAKTKNLWRKQDAKDLFVINYRFGGLAEKILETHQIVLVKRTKDRVRSEKDSGGVYVRKVGFP